mmetsp:Transcript_35210/g.87427  ORF Transcript_35210/g.87427 Transcript_35210/m.87427 type:complete len:149 (+) Transcript_35210:677-1123(+)
MRDGRLDAMRAIYIFARKGKACLSETTEMGSFPIHYAAEGENVAMIDQLLSWGGKAELDKQDKKKRTPFLIAAVGGHVRAMRAMHAVGGNALLEQHDEDGNYAIHLAVEQFFLRREFLPVVKQLMDWGGAHLLTKENNEVAFPVALMS